MFFKHKSETDSLFSERKKMLTKKYSVRRTRFRIGTAHLAGTMKNAKKNGKIVDYIFIFEKYCMSFYYLLRDLFGEIECRLCVQRKIEATNFWWFTGWWIRSYVIITSAKLK